jgi:hypothetical protein
MLRFALLTDARPEPSQTGFPRIHDVFDDTVEEWTGYPLTTSAIPHSPTLYLRERCRLVEIIRDLHALVLAKGDPCVATVQGYVKTVGDLVDKMQRWNQRLPFELQYRWPSSVAVCELQSVYISFRAQCLAC